MNAKTINKNKPQQAFVTIRNAETSTTISAGSPVFYKFGGDDYDGVDVIGAATQASAAKSVSCIAGVAVDTLTAGKTGRALVYGLIKNARFIRMTKAASTDIWASMAAVAVGDVWGAETVNNGIGAVATALASNYLPFIVAAQSLASTTTAASNNFSSLVPLSATALVWPLKAWVRVI